MLHEFITKNREEIIALCRVKVASRSAPRPTAAELHHGVPLFLDQLAEILRLHTSSNPGIRDGAALHGTDLLRQGFTVGQVVQDYGDICQSITDLALDRKAPISTEEFRTLNQCLDDAIANAVTEYGKQRDRRISEEGTERLGVFAHELRNLLNSAMLSFEVLRMGSVGVGGATGSILGRSLSGLRDLVDRALADTRLDAGLQNRERISLSDFIEEVEVSAAMEARARDLRLTVSRPDEDASVDADRHILNSVVTNLLQNAFKFTRPGGHVTLRSSADAGRVRMEIEDECGGLPAGSLQEILLPFEQRGRDRSGLGLGLTVTQRGVEASGGVLDVRNMPGKGCVFSVDLPRAADSQPVEMFS